MCLDPADNFHSRLSHGVRTVPECNRISQQLCTRSKVPILFTAAKCQNLATHASPTVRDFAILTATFKVHWALSLIFVHSIPQMLLTYLCHEM